MLLAVVIGNNESHFCLLKNGQPKAYFRTPTDTHRSADKYSTFLIKKLNDVNITYEDIRDMVVSSTVPSINLAIHELGAKFLHLSPLIIEENTLEWGFKVDVSHPEKIPPCLLIDVVATNSFYGSPALIINFGSITTFIVTSPEGNLVGGVLSPGCNLALKEFCDYAGLPNTIPLKYPDKITGKTLEGALQSGIVVGHISMVRTLIQRVLDEQQHNMLVVATGHCLDQFKDYIPEITYWDPMLTMQGLYQLYEQNKSLFMKQKYLL